MKTFGRTAGFVLLGLFMSSCGAEPKFASDVRSRTAAADARPEPDPEPVAIPEPIPVPVVVIPEPTPVPEEVVVPVEGTVEAVPVPEPEPAPLVAQPVTPAPLPEPVDDKIFKVCEGSNAKFRAELYQLSPDTHALPDFTKLTALNTICLNQLDITDRDFAEGFPGVNNLIEFFGLNVTAKITVPADGSYAFALTSDDGARLAIDGKEVIDNDGDHQAQTREGAVFLKAGEHTMNVRYYQGPRFRIALELKWKTPGSADFAYIPLENVSRP